MKVFIKHSGSDHTKLPDLAGVGGWGGGRPANEALSANPEPTISWICCRKITDLAEKVGFKDKGDAVL